MQSSIRPCSKARLRSESGLHTISICTGHGGFVDWFTDLKIRVVFDELTKGQFSANEQRLYEKLRGKQFDVLGCHSNGAMICLAALENKDIKAENVVLYGPQVTRESLEMWDKLVQPSGEFRQSLY